MASSVFVWPGLFYNNGSTVVFTLPLALPDGSASAPSLTFTSDTTTGWYKPANNFLGMTGGGGERLRLSSSVILSGAGTLGWDNGGTAFITSATADVLLQRDAANTLALKNSTNLQTFRVYDSSGTGYTAYAGTGITTYKNVVTAGSGVQAVYGYGDVAAATNTGTASIATYTVGAADGTFRISANCLITTSTTHSFSLDCTYTDEGNTARTLVIPVAQLAGTFLTSGLITNVTGAGPYESATMTIRAKASTAITIRTSAGGTFTTVVYNARGVIAQVS